MLRSILQRGWAPLRLAVVMGLLGVPFSVSARNLDAKVDSLRAAAADTSRAWADRVKDLKWAIRMDLTGGSHYQLARLYMEEGGPDDQLDVEFWLQGAIARDRKNAEFRATYAKLLWQLDEIETANVQAKKALEIDPDQVCALYYAGRYAAWGMDRHYRTISMGYSNQIAVPFSLRAFGEDRMRQAIEHLTHAIEVDPGHDPARQLLALVYYEAEEYDSVIDLFEERVVKGEDADSFFFVGLAFQGKGYLKTAYRYYLKGFDLLSEDEQTFFRSIVLAGDKANSGGLDGFWTERDPLFLSPLNERLMDHCGRVAYANLRFSDSHQELKGWETDKGELYIRYGEPKERVVRAGEFNRPRLEVWAYDDFTLWFANPISSAWKFEGARIRRISIDVKEDFIERVYERFPDPYAWDRYRPLHQLAQFRERDGETRVEFYYALPQGRVQSSGQGAGFADVDLRKGVFLFDANWDTVKTTVTDVQRLPRVRLKSIKRDYYFVSEQFQVAPGEYYFAVEAENPETREIGSVRDSVQVRAFSSDSLEISSVLLARRIELRGEQRDRADFRILPNPLRRYDFGSRGAIYFEIYNLSQDAFGETHYEVTYQLRSVPEVGSPSKARWMTALTYEHKGSTANEPVFFNMDFKTIPPGLWDVRVVIRDLTTDETALSHESFRVLW